MSKKYAVYIASCAAIAAFVLGMFLPAFVDLPVLLYRPVERAWTFAHGPGIAMDFFGRCLFACAVSSVTAAIAYAWARRRRRDPMRTTVAVWAVWAILFTLLGVAFVAWRQLHKPAPAANAHEQPRR